jgi:hypothetical protein
MTVRKKSLASKLVAAETAVAAQDWPKAVSLVGAILEALPEGSNLPGELYPVLKQVAPHDSYLMFNLAGMKLRGAGTRRDLKGASEIYRRLALGDDLNAARASHSVLGNIAAGDYGGKADATKALRHFEQAARLGDHVSALNAAMAHRYGIGTEVDLDAAERLFRQVFSATAGQDPQTCVELAVLLVRKGTPDTLGEAYSVLIDCGDATEVLREFREVFEDSSDYWNTVDDFVEAFEKRMAQRLVMSNVLERSSAFDRMLRLGSGFPADRLCMFAEVFLGWQFVSQDPFAGQFGDWVGDVVSAEDKLFPVFGVRCPMDASDSLIVRTKSAIAKQHRDAVILPSILVNGSWNKEPGEWLGYGLLLKDGRWSEFALMPAANGFDTVLAEAGEMERAPEQYFGSKRVVDLPDGLSNWIEAGGWKSKLKRLTEECRAKTEPTVSTAPRR